MTKSEMIREAALTMRGCPYVYGGTGQKCTPAYRRQQAEQYPTMANAIRKNCPVLSGKQDTCDGCKYQGKKAYDCAQVTRISARAAELTLPSGASSQWNKGDWAQKGAIDTLPRDKVCMVYQERKDSNPMGHTGVYLGDGMVVDARSHADGVLYGPVEGYKWTHWAILRGMEEAEMGDNVPEKPAQRQLYIVTGKNLALRADASTKSAVLTRLKTGTSLIGEPISSAWVQVVHNGMTGYCMAQYLAPEPHQAPAMEESTVEPDDQEKLRLHWAWYQQTMNMHKAA